MASQQTSVVAFSSDGDYLACSSADGIIKLWETSTGNLVQEFSPSKHLTATCTCLRWGPGRHLHSTKTRKKRKSTSDAQITIDNLNLVAIGTTNGSILLYSFSRGHIHTHLEGGHTEQVRDVCWYPGRSHLYSCSLDGHVVEWDVATSQVKEKWKANRGGVHSMCLCSSSRLLTASRVIKMWDLGSKTLIQKFTGHSTEISHLLPVPHADSGSDPLACWYFLSAASGDRVVNACWQMVQLRNWWNDFMWSRMYLENFSSLFGLSPDDWHSEGCENFSRYCHPDSKEKNAITSFSLPDEPVSLNLKTSSEQVLQLAVVTTKSQALVFQHKLNGKLKTPLHPKTVLQACTAGSKEEMAVPVPILAAFPDSAEGRSLLVVHGSYLKPKFEVVALSPDQPEVVMVVAPPAKKATKDGFSQVKTPEVTSNKTVLYPSQMAPSGPSKEPGTRKRKKSVSELSLGERLNAISGKGPDQQLSSGASKPPKADTLVNLLTRGLQSKDSKILTNVLQERDEQVIKNTIRRLPLPLVLPLVEELAERMHGHAQSGQTAVRWLKSMLSTHTSYLMTVPEIVDKMGELYQMTEWRLQTFPRLAQLLGRLDLLLSQVTSQSCEEEEPLSASQPLLVYQDESSDEEMPEVYGASESEDNWEDMSDKD